MCLQDAKNLRLVNTLLRGKVEILAKKILILTARSRDHLLQILKLPHVKAINLELKEDVNLTDEEICNLLERSCFLLKTVALLSSNLSGISLVGSTVQFEKLEHLNLFDCKELKDRGLTELLSACGPKLKFLDISFTNVSGESLAKANLQLNNLETLKLKYCYQLTNSGLKEFLRISRLKLNSLDLSNTNVSGDNLTGSTLTLDNLKTLYLRSCQRLTDVGLLALLRMSVHLNSLDLFFTEVSGDNLSAPTSKLDSLKTLTLYYCQLLTDTGLLGLLSMSGHQLRYLDLSWTTVSLDILAGTALQLNSLETLNLSHCFGITESGLQELLRICRLNLKSLDLSKTNVSGDGLSESTLELDNLKTLILNSCSKLTCTGLFALLRMSGLQLSILDLSYTNVGGADLADWMEQQPLLQLRWMMLTRCSRVTAADVERLTTVLTHCEIRR